MYSVTAPDGTAIGYEREGTGPPLVLLHGTPGRRETWARLRPHLADDYTLVVPDRRGRGASGDTPDHSLDSEIGDVRALCSAIEGDPLLVGHSYGGLVALAAAARTDLGLDRLVLYEPALLVGPHREGADLAARLRERLAEGDRRGVVAEFFRTTAGESAVEALPIEDHTPLAETIVRECRAIERYRLGDPDIPVPTLLLTGETSPDQFGDAVRALDERLGNARLRELSDVGHSGIWWSPEPVAEAVRSFCQA